MTRIILSTGNIISGGPSIIRKPGTYRSNLELTNSLRSNFLAAQQEYPETHAHARADEPAPNGHHHHHHDAANGAVGATTPREPAWTLRVTPRSDDDDDDINAAGDTLYVPRIDFSGAGLQEDRAAYEVTVKMFFLQPLAARAEAGEGEGLAAQERARHVRQALGLVARELGLQQGGGGGGGLPQEQQQQNNTLREIDLLIASFPGISFEGDCEWEADKRNAAMGCDADEAATWAVLESLVADADAAPAGGSSKNGSSENGDREKTANGSSSNGTTTTNNNNGNGVSASSSSSTPPHSTLAPAAAAAATPRIRRLGIAEFGSDKLARFLRLVRVRPAVDQINTRNCCSVPPPLAELAAREGVELYSHSDCTDVLPSGTLRELLGGGGGAAGLLAGAADAAAEAGAGAGLKGDLVPQWVVKYTAFVKDRGVIENKGYFAGADLHDGR